MPIILCFINQKGGCGKSSTCFHLAGAFAEMGERVTLVDADPQGSLSQGFLGSSLVENLELPQTTAAVLDATRFQPESSTLLRPTEFERIALLPANQHLAAFNTPCPESSGLEQYALRNFLREKLDADIVLIDCPPNLYRCSWSAMVAADYVLIPIPPEDFGTQGLRAVHQAIDHARLLNPTLRNLGHLVTRSDSRLLVHRAYEAKLRELYGELVMETVIPEASAFKAALACRKPVEYYGCQSKAAKLTNELAREILHRVSTNQEQRRVA